MPALNSDIAAFVYDGAGTIRWWSGGAERLLGYSAEEAVGRTTVELRLDEGAQAPAEAPSDGGPKRRRARTRSGGSASLWYRVMVLEDGTTERRYLELLWPAGTAEAETASVPAPGDAEPSRATIVVVEDNAMVRRSIEATLRGLGFRVIPLATGEECVDVVKGTHETIDLLITDVMLPRMSGKELIERLRGLVPELPVLFMSGYDRSTLGGPYESGTSEHFLQKPFDSEDLSAAVTRAMAGGGRR